MTFDCDRRWLLRSSFLGLAALGFRPWVERAFAEFPGREDGGGATRSDRARALAQARVEALARGEPMLVFLVPRVRCDRGRVVGTYLETASDAAHADLALCEVAIATVAELRALLPGLERTFDSEPMAVLVELDGRTARPVVEAVRSPPLPRMDGSGIARVDPQREVRWRVPIEEEFRRAIARDGEELGRRAREARARLASGDRDRLDALDARGERWSEQDVALCPAWAKRSDPGSADELASLSRARLVDHSPRGARWARYEGGCGGVRLEDPPQSLPSAGPCGTGMMPQPSRRFLWLYTKSDP